MLQPKSVFSIRLPLFIDKAFQHLGTWIKIRPSNMARTVVYHPGTWIKNCPKQHGQDVHTSSGHPNQKPSEQHDQDNHVSSRHLNWTSHPCHTQVKFFTIWKDMRSIQAGKTKSTPLLWEYSNSYSLPPSNSCSLWQSRALFVMRDHPA